jgi:hypothetical protein
MTSKVAKPSQVNRGRDDPARFAASCHTLVSLPSSRTTFQNTQSSKALELFLLSEMQSIANSIISQTFFAPCPGPPLTFVLIARERRIVATRLRLQLPKMCNCLSQAAYRKRQTIVHPLLYCPEETPGKSVHPVWFRRPDRTTQTLRAT